MSPCPRVLTVRVLRLSGRGRVRRAPAVSACAGLVARQWATACSTSTGGRLSERERYDCRDEAWAQRPTASHLFSRLSVLHPLPFLRSPFVGESQVKISPRGQWCQPLAGVREGGHWKESANLRRSTRLVWRIPLPAALPFAEQARKARTLFAGRISRFQLRTTQALLPASPLPSFTRSQPTPPRSGPAPFSAPSSGP